MTTPVLSKGEIRERSAQLRVLMCEWDPLGVMGDSDCPCDEYDCLVGPLLTLLDSGASKEEIARYLREEIDEHCGRRCMPALMLGVGRNGERLFLGEDGMSMSSAQS